MIRVTITPRQIIIRGHAESGRDAKVICSHVMLNTPCTSPAMIALTRRASLLAALSTFDDGSGTLGIIVDHALAEDPAVTVEAVREIVIEAIADAKLEAPDRRCGDPIE